MLPDSLYDAVDPSHQLVFHTVFPAGMKRSAISNLATYLSRHLADTLQACTFAHIQYLKPESASYISYFLVSENSSYNIP